MINKLLIVLGVVVLVLMGHSIVYACGGGCGCGANKAVGQETTGKSTAIEVGNKTCPVMGGDIIEGSEVKVEHEGKVYNLCCVGCIRTFKNDPKKYIEKIKENEKNISQQGICSDIQDCNG
ncbi:MAG: hypothetical protein A2306_03620 [Omnitrophica WOR_2 bacterium RIFOXYB2_FULL_38_16]|nr:MAG: hypothetical protein A2243_02705 [Omnitrophica WOR_2 bacterium RIFOXYA2_FULL_38_17]OGX50934.1 MAG: hypothetical protein A2267_00145 [Omnitrophica WOR_2 bacterium RIFOXYA12_FULL_38_10]OGX56779.1 MAG: hypothetical protein A2447_01060 [Omnitrophica WOR_2 bacterium RIFOXYC2_FULL_38_12]OGX57857.1 MAG: hypothetical protein A2306_03620 [Omnitrophica WOR_2 bacterium RIFOXYB2_FULL_38_16]HBG62484.1 hypothetical protein [Candidatus Omnitrophota bacterium]